MYGADDQALEVGILQIRLILGTGKLLAVRLLEEDVERLGAQDDVRPVVDVLGEVHLEVVEDQLGQQVVVSRAHRVLIDLDGKRWEDQGGLALLDAAVRELLDLLLLDVEVLHEILAIPREKLVARREHVVVVDVEIQALQEVRVDLLREVHLECGGLDGQLVRLVELLEVDTFGHELV